MTRVKIIMELVLALSLSACQKHFISNPDERNEVEASFNKRKQALKNGDLFYIFQQSMTQEEKESLQFMYAYMPLGDITDYSGEFHLTNVQSALKARSEMKWGKDIPEQIFRHFVLPYRVNNENLDNARTVFYKELKERVQNLSLHDAILEINHWCHEKVSYTPSDIRTSSPLATLHSAYGRCGEESTFAVAAFRAMCIPARQVYTPRWAHTDDNHAWVEVWVNGQWHFLGACEPEPVLDLAWFNAPASRGMLMHTKVFGHYYGTEEVMQITDNYTEINVIKNYANAATTCVKVTTPDGKPVKNALVEFKLYNYAEFHTVAKKTTDKDGLAFQTAGLGDMLVWASANGRFGYCKCSFGKNKEINIILDKNGSEGTIMELDIVPPYEKNNTPNVSTEQREENNQRFAYKDSIRQTYINTFPTKEKLTKFIQEQELNPCVIPLIDASRGNYITIMSFLKDTPIQKRSEAIKLLQVISPKDLRDIDINTLNEHLYNTLHKPKDRSQKIQDLYVLNPRVTNEMIYPYKKELRKIFSQEEAELFRNNPHLLAKWCQDNITIHNEWNTQHIPMSPIGVARAKVADEYSLQIFFVSAARSLNIPARIDEVTGKVQFFKDNKPHDVELIKKGKTLTTSQGFLKANYTPSKILDDPKYYTHFTLSKLENGRTHLLNYPEEGISWSTLLKNGTTLDTGNYLMITGTRMANGSVLTHMTFFTIKEGRTTTVNLNMRESKDNVQVIGNFNSENKYRKSETDEEVSILSATGRGYYILGILGIGQEPSNHALRDIAALKKDFEKWNHKIVLLFPDKNQIKKFRKKDFPAFPNTIVWGTDINNNIQKEIIEALKLSSKQNLPIFIIADTFNRVVFVSQGYTIGLGEQLMKTIYKL